jgi:phospholipase C
MRKLLLLAAALILAALPTVPAAAMPVDETPTATPIKHAVWIMQDNHSFDNYFGTYPGADGIPQGVCQRVNLNRRSTVGCVQPFHLGDTPVEDLTQGPGIQRRQYNNGQMDGFVAAYRRLGRDGTSAMGYYDGSDIPFHWNTADQYVLFDRFFSSTTVGSREAYLYWLAGQAPAGPTPLDSSAGYDALPTVFDRLAERQISARFYVENLDEAATSADQAGVRRSSQLVKVPLLSMKRFRDGGKFAGQVVDLNQYYDDLRDGTLPAVSYIVTTGSSENPPADPAAGSRTLRKITGELMRSSSWTTSALMWTYDGWGGWYDHVPPPRVDSEGYGFRVPALLVSPYAKRGVVDHTVLDYTAMLKFIELNWQLAPLSTRDQQSAGLVSAFDFSASARPPVLPALTWPAPQESLSAENPAPVIYSAYGVAAALAITVLSLAFRGRPVTVPAPVGRAGVLVRSWLEPLLRQALRSLLAAQTRRGPARRSAHSYDWSRATLAVTRYPRPVVATEGEAWGSWSPEITRIPAGRGPVSVAAGGDHHAEAVSADAAASAASPTSSAEPDQTAVHRESGLPAEPKDAGLMTACTQPLCTGTIVDGYCDVCGSPAGAVPFLPAESTASAASVAPADEPGLTAVLASTSAPNEEIPTQRLPRVEMQRLQSPTQMADPETADRGAVDAHQVDREKVDPSVADGKIDGGKELAEGEADGAQDHVEEGATANLEPVTVVDVEQGDTANLEPATADTEDSNTATVEPATADAEDSNTATVEPATADAEDSNTATVEPATADAEDSNTATVEPAAADTEDGDTATVEPAAADAEDSDTATVGPKHDDTVKMPADPAEFSEGRLQRAQLLEPQVRGDEPVQTPAKRRRFGCLALATTALAMLLIGAVLFAASRDRGVTAQSAPTVTATATTPVSMPTSEPPNESTDTVRLGDVSNSARPFQTVRIDGTYRSGPNTFMRVQRWEGGKWLDFPLPTKTDQSGQFTAYVELGQPGRYRLRVVHPDSGVTSKPFVLVING